MTDALLTEPQTPTDGQTAAQPETPDKGTPAPAPESQQTGKPEAEQQQKQPADASKQQATDVAKKEAPKPPRPGLVTEGEKADSKKTEAAPAAPEKWELKNEGEHKVAPELLSTYEKVAREVGMKAGDAQKMLDTLRTAARENEQRMLDMTIGKWADELKAHPTLGGDNLDETLANGRKALAEFGTPELSELLLQTGLQYHPAIVGLLAQVHQKVGGDRIVTGASPKGGADRSAQGFYDRMPKG